MNNRVTNRERLGFTAGYAGNNIMVSLVTAFVMYFFTDVMKISVMQVGTIMLIGGIADAISDPLMGIIVDRTRSKMGKCRPHILRYAIPMAISVILVYRVPQNTDPGFRFIYGLITYVFFTLAYTAVNIPLITLLSNATDVPEDRLNLNVFGTIGTNIGQLSVMMFALSLVQKLGRGDEAKGYFFLAILFGVIGAVLLFICSMTTRERLSENTEKTAKLTTGQMLRSFVNAPWLIIAVTLFLLISVFVLRSTQTIYFCQYYLKDQSLASPLMSVANLLGFPTALLCPFLAMKFGKKNLVVASCVISALGCAVSLFAGTNYILLMAGNVLISLGISIINGIIFVMAAEAVDYGEFKHGFRSQGILMSVIAFAVKIANSLVTMLASAVLDVNGYVGGAETQIPSAINAIRINYIIIPLIIFVFVGVLNMFYTLDKKYPEVRAALDARREEATKANNDKPEVE